MRRLLGQREFVAYFLARQGAGLASRIEGVAVGWQVFLLRHQPFDLGLVGLALFVPQVALAFPAGFIADRFDRRAVCVLSTLGACGGMVAYLALALTGSHSLASYLLVTLAIGSAHAIAAPAQRSMLAGIVRSGEFVRSAALSNTIGELIDFAGPALGGVLLFFGTPIAFGGAALVYGAAVFGYAALRPRGPAHERVGLVRGAREAIRFIVDKPVLLGAISLDLFAVLFGGATALLPVYADQILHVGPLGLGALRSAPAIGAGLVAFAIVRRPLERRAGPLMFLTVAGFGVATIVFGASRNIWLSLVALAAIGAFDMVSVVIRQALVQLGTPDALRGRVSAIENMFIGASNELGEFESGTLASFIGTQPSVVLGGIATLAVIAMWAVFFPPLRRFDRLTGPAKAGELDVIP